MVVYFKDDPIRVVEIGDEWWFVLKDVCEACKIKNSNDAASRIFPDFMRKGSIGSTDTSSTNGRHLTGYEMILVNEKGVYQCLMNSRKLEARQFQMWVFEILSKLRQVYGLNEFDAFLLTESSIQDEMSNELDNWYYYDRIGQMVQFDPYAGR